MITAIRGFLRSLTVAERLQIFSMYFMIFIATLFGIAASVFVGRVSVVLGGFGIVAYVFGLRHGLDADHIAAIDNTTRKLMQQGKKPVTVGAWFSLGHSTIVFVLIVALVSSTRMIAQSIPYLQSMGAIMGTAISGTFLWLIGLLNVAVVLEIYKIYKGLRTGKIDSGRLDETLNKRGFMNRVISPVFKVISKPRDMYPVGVLFGLGFDTASEVALIAISVGVGISSSVPVWMILILPFMFTCGMVLVDATDGVTMRFAYGWAFLNPIRKIYYNMTITVISVLVAFLIGGVELLQVLAGELGFNGSFWNWLSNLNFETMGVGVVSVFVISWLVSVVIYKHKRIEETSLGGQGQVG